MKKSLVRFLCLVMAALMALGCVSALAEEDDFSGKITISLYSAKGVEEAWRAVGDAYTAKHPNAEVVVDLKPQDGYADWVKAAFQGYDSALPEADIVYGNLAGSDRVDKVVNFYDYAFDESAYSDGEWADQIAFDMQNIDMVSGSWDCVSITGVQVLWFYNVDIFNEVGVKPPKTWDEFVDVCAKIEAELSELDAEEAAEYLKDLGIEASGLDVLARVAYSTLGLQSYFTAGEMEVKAWTIPVGAKAPQAAGVIHSDFERGFIKAEVASYDDYVTLGGEAGCKAAGKLRMEGKDYVVADGDVMHFRFNV